MAEQVIDPVCGMSVEKEGNSLKAGYRGREYFFCSEECLHRFEDRPEQFAGNAA